MQVRVPKKLFDLFKQECEYWHNRLGLHKYRLVVFFTELKSDTSLANCYVDSPDLTVRISLNTYVPYTKPTPDEIAKAAFHEIFELLLWPHYTALVGSIYSADYSLELGHEIIRTMEKELWAPWWEINSRSRLAKWSINGR